MRVLYLSKALVVGSYQRKMEEMAALPDVQLTVAVPPSWRDERGELRLERRHTQGYDLIELPLVLNGNYHLHFYRGWAELVRQVQPDVVHLDEEPYNLATWLALRAVRRVRPTAKVLWFSWQNLYRQYPPPFRWLEADVLRRSDGALFGNRAAADVFARKGWNGPRVVIPQFGVDPALFPLREGWPAPQGRLRVLYLGRLMPEKGLDTALQALARLDAVSTLDIIGSGPELAHLQQRTAALRLTERVTFTPWLPSDAVAGRLAQADVLILPSQSRPNWQEQFGRVLIEAMAVGVPVVGSNCGEIPNVIGEAGLTFSEGDAQGLAAALAALRDNPANYTARVVAGRARVLQHFTQASIAAQTVAFYRMVLEY